MKIPKQTLIKDLPLTLLVQAVREEEAGNQDEAERLFEAACHFGEEIEDGSDTEG